MATNNGNGSLIPASQQLSILDQTANEHLGVGIATFRCENCPCGGNDKSSLGGELKKCPAYMIEPDGSCHVQRKMYANWQWTPGMLDMKAGWFKAFAIVGEAAITSAMTMLNIAMACGDKAEAHRQQKILVAMHSGIYLGIKADAMQDVAKPEKSVLRSELERHKKIMADRIAHEEALNNNTIDAVAIEVEDRAP